MDHLPRFKRALLRMLQTGAFAKMLGCRNGCCAQIIFHLQRIYHVHFTERYIVLHERDVETVRRHTNGRWQRKHPLVYERDRIIIDRANGHILDPALLDQQHVVGK